jgi:hypothetical protein
MRQTQASSGIFKVPTTYWDELEKKDFAVLCRYGEMSLTPSGGLLIPFLNKEILLDPQQRLIQCRQRHHWRRIHYPLLELLCLVYVNTVRPETVSGEMVGVQEFRSAQFFRGPHELKVQPVLQHFGMHPESFAMAAQRLGGEPVDLADIAFCFRVFPKVPVNYLLWKGDEEFGPQLTVLFDRSIENHLAPDAIWGVVYLVSELLVSGSSLLPCEEAAQGDVG